MSMKKARILVDTPLDGVQYKPNQVIEAEADTIKELVKAGFADDKAAAVKYCLADEDAKVIKHEPAVQAEEVSQETAEGAQGEEGAGATED